ncbi:cilia- and flagella-associated protein 70 [Bombina bombina]|uniref:cilia- and flagella-associated protein 70 n=1 Tax=Bombina bombina TaxID=8345 RepID=UPI00235AC3FC|nr:cilia- and flagella-associated protein 70 [Bombina bombina]
MQGKEAKIILLYKSLKGLKGDTPLTYLRSEFNNILLGDSPKLEVSEEHSIEYNFTTSFDIGPDSPHSLDDLTHKPAILTVIEILPKEKKQKEEKTVTLGQTVVDLLPLLKGECNFKVILPLHPAPGSPLETIHPDAKPSLEVAVSVPEPLLSESQINKWNLLRMTLEAAYCVPESWNHTGPHYNYVAGLVLPTVGQKDRPLVFNNGVLKAGGEIEPVPRLKKWPTSGITAPGAQTMPDSFILGGAYEEEDGEMNKKEDREFRIDAETNKKKVMWDSERRYYLDPSSLISLQKRIAESRYWPVEIIRLPLATSPKGKGGKTEKVEEDGQIFFHGVAYVNMVPLLYPGAKRLRGAFRVFPYLDSDVLDKTSAMSKPPEVSADVESTAVTTAPNVEGQQFVESGTYIVLEITLEKPLVPKRSAEEVALRVKDLIPPRPQLPSRTARAQKAVEDYKNQIVSITNSVLKEYMERFDHQKADGQEVDKQALEERKCQLMYELNCSGKYFAFKEQLKHSVVKIVREKFQKTTAFDDPEKLQDFLNDLYIYLVDKMHECLNTTLFSSKEELPSLPVKDTEKLLRFAKEAEFNEDLNLAELYYQERLAHDRQCIDHWLDYGGFKLLTGDYTKAQECFHEAVTLNRDHTHSLILCGILAVLMDRYEEAEVFFEDATCVDPHSIIAWTMLGLFYEIQGNDIRMEMAFTEAGKLSYSQLSLEGQESVSETRREATDQGTVSKGVTEDQNENASKLPQSHLEKTVSLISRTPEERTVLSMPKSTSSKQKPASLKEASTSSITTSLTQTKPSSIFMKTAEFLSRYNITQFIQRALAHELLSTDGGPSCKYYLMCAQMHILKKEFDEANKNLQEAFQIDHQNPDVWALTGHLKFLRGKKDEAKEWYEHTLSLVEDASDMHPVYLRLGAIYLENEEYEKAKNTFLLGCKKSPTCQTWLGVGIACYRLDELKEASDAFSEANALNNTNAEVWGYLTLVCLKSGRQLEAEQTYKYTKKFNLQDQFLLSEIHDMQKQCGAGDLSF